jgi:hypothetical protein
MPLSFRLPVLALALAAASSMPRAAIAQSALTAEDLFVGLQPEQGRTFSDAEIANYFNRARCLCDMPIYIYTKVLASGVAKGAGGTQGSVQVWVGEACNDVAQRGACVQVGSSTVAELFAAGQLTLTTSTAALSTPPAATAGEPCTASAPFNQTVWVFLDTNNDGTPDVTLRTSATIDLTPPPAPNPASVLVAPRSEGLTITWPTLDRTAITDIAGYQVLCNRAGSLQVFDTGTFIPGFESCPAASNGAGVEGLDPAFVCSPMMTPDADTDAISYTVKGLEDGISYGVAVVVIDSHGNASPPAEVIYETPVRMQGFYDLYRGAGGTTDGGLCALAPGESPRAPLGGTAALLFGVAVLVTRRRR